MTSEMIMAFALALSEEEMKADRLAAATIRAAKKAQKEFALWMDRKGYTLETMGKTQLREYHKELCDRKNERTGEPIASVTINAMFQKVLVLFSILYREGVIKENPAHNLELAVHENRGLRRRPLTLEEITEFLESIDTSTQQGLKDRTMFELIYSSGLRVSEAAGIRIRDIDFERREVIVRGKGDRDRVVPISKVARDFLLVFLGERIQTPDAWVFTGSIKRCKEEKMKGGGISIRFRRLLKRFNMNRKEISTHSIRHSTATHLLENGASVRHIQELLGHKYIETTVRYTQIQSDGVFKVYRKYHPREHEMFEAVDEEYLRRFEVLLDWKSRRK